MNHRKIPLLITLFFVLLPPVWTEQPAGSDSLAELYSPVFAGRGGFSTSRWSASSPNPAAGGESQLLMFDAAYMGLSNMRDDEGFGHSAALGALLPTKYASFGAGLRFLRAAFDDFNMGTTFGGNFNIAKEIYPKMSVGAALNFGFGSGWTASGDLGFRYNMGKLGFTDNFTWAATLKNIGKSYPAIAFTPVLGVSLDLVSLQTQKHTDAFRLNLAADLGFPGFANMSGKAGLTATIADLLIIGASLGFNAGEIIDGYKAASMPSLGIGIKFTLEDSGKTLPGGIPSDGDLAVNMGLKPLPGSIWGIGGGVSWTAGVLDKKPPVIALDYPETLYLSPNNDGLADALETGIGISDQRYVTEWAFEIRDEAGNVIRTIRNKEKRPETQGVKNFIGRLTEVKSGVDIPETLRWDGITDSGAPAADGRYFFSVSAADDNGNKGMTERYEFVLDNTAPEISLASPPDTDRIFSPDGDGNKDNLAIAQDGSAEDLWDAGIYDAAGTKVRSFDIHDGVPAAIAWNGQDDGGSVVPDGVYTYRISAEDRAYNSASAVIENIIVNTQRPTVGLVISHGFFSPNGDGVQDSLSISPAISSNEGITSWLLEIKDADGITRRSFSRGEALSGGTPAEAGGGEAVPKNIEFDGKDALGALLGEGSYKAEIAVNYRNGFVSTASSPNFVLDITRPEADIRAAYAAFSPNNDGIQDTMIFSQEGSRELAWTGEIRTPGGGGIIRSFRFAGTPGAKLEWDGMDDAGRLAPDGEYEYSLLSTDLAGNNGSSRAVRFTLSTADTPVMIHTGTRAFSPNNDGVRDTVLLLPSLDVMQGVTSYRVDVLDSEGKIVRAFSANGPVPPGITWDGKDSAGIAAPDGIYTAQIRVNYVQGNQPGAKSLNFLLDTKAPETTFSLPYAIFSPNHDERRDTLPVNINSAGDDEWRLVIENTQGNEVRHWEWKGSAPSVEWDGKDTAGNLVPDGNYRFMLRSQDEAGNTYRETVSTITLDARVPKIFFTVSAGAIAPKEGSASPSTRFQLMLDPKDGTSGWKLELRDESGTPRRSFPAPESSGEKIPPGSILWDGRDEDGKVIEGRYTALLTVNYEKGDSVEAAAGPVTVDISGPKLGFITQPEYFSPDNDGDDDELYISLGAEDLSPVASWSFEIREPVPPNLLFWRVEGRGTPSERIVWDGRSNRGELVQAATDYPAVFRAADSLGNSSEIKGTIGVDVLVIRDGNLLRIQVPSIIFRENAADFENLPPDTAANNIRVLTRVAEILNKFRDYRVTVEGHANPVFRTAAEERNELQPLSEARAGAIVEWLTRNNVERGRLSSVGMGGSRPVVRFEDHDNWWKNRRVEFILNKRN